MRKLIATATVLALAACGDDAPEDEASPPAPAESEIASAPTTPTPSPTGASQGEADAEGNRWFYKADSGMAIFGPPESEGVLSIACRTSESGAPEILVRRYTEAQENEVQSLEFLGQNSSALVRVSSTTAELGPEFFWQGALSPPADDLRSVFAGSTGPVSVRLESGNAMKVPASDEVLRAIDACS